MLPSSEPLRKNTVLNVAGVVMLALYSLQNLIPGAASLPRPAAYALVAVFSLTAAALFFRELRRDLPVFLDHFTSYCRFFFPKFFLFLLIYFAAAVTIAVIVGETSANQAALTAFPKWMLLLLALVYAPVMEEILYRGFLRRVIADEALFIVVSAVIFGAIHMMHPGQDPLQFLYIIEYSLLGGFLAYLYAKTDNIFVSMMGHFFLNAIAAVPLLLTM